MTCVMRNNDPQTLEPESDETLLRACRQGDQAAWERLIRRYQRLIYAIPRRAGLNEDLAAEVFQRVWVTLVEHLNRIEQPNRLGAWLATTARRESWRQLRTQSSANALPEGDDDAETLATLPDPAMLPDEVLERLERQHLVRRALSTLDERCRALLTLLFYTQDPPSYAEIAGSLGIPEGSIGPTRGRCLQRLRQALEQLEREGGRA